MSARSVARSRTSVLICSLGLCAAIGSGCAGRRTTTSRPSAGIAVNPTALDFGDLSPGAQANLALEVTNTGGDTLAITSVDISGPDVAAFSATPVTATVSPGGRVTLAVTFTAPSQVGSFTASLTISSNAAGSPEVGVPLTATVGQTCATLTCAAHATCQMTTTASCVCDSGYGPTGSACALLAPMTINFLEPAGGACNSPVAQVSGTDTLSVSVMDMLPLTNIAVVDERGNVVARESNPTRPALQQQVSWLAALGPGSHTLTATATDTQGRTATAMLSVDVLHDITVAVGGYTVCATVDGNVMCWGNNVSGELGNNTLVSAPMPVPGPPASGVSVGWSHTCGIENGGAFCWGWNSDGELGDNTMTLSAVPVPVQGLSAGVQAVSAGVYHSCAIVNGGLQCWGLDSAGELGDGTMNRSLVPVQVAGLTSGVESVVTGWGFTCAIVQGGAECWGGSAMIPTATPVPGLSSGVQAIGMGEGHTCAVVNGGLQCWGLNHHGQLGNDSTTASTTPVQVNGLTAGVQAVGGGWAHTCALVNGGVWCWGDNAHGELGNNSMTESHVPVQVPGLECGVQGLAVGYLFACAVMNGSVLCWGDNSAGQLGNNSMSQSSVPVPVAVAGQ